MAVATEALRAGTRSRILDAALAAVTTFGLSRFTMDDVARAAGTSRQTVYRYFDSKDDLVMAVVYREEEAFVQGVRDAFGRHGDLETAMREAMLFCLRAVREHPLLDRLLASEPEVLLPYLTTRGAGVVARGRAALEELVGGRADVRHELVHRAADVAARIIVSYALTPSEDPPEDIARETARLLVTAVRKPRKEDRR
jgi:AcrR family transcriptional regulator